MGFGLVRGSPGTPLHIELLKHTHYDPELGKHQTDADVLNSIWDSTPVTILSLSFTKVQSNDRDCDSQAFASIN